MSSIGKMCYRVTIQSRSTGAGAVTWSNTVTTWAEVVSQPTPAESASASALRSTVLYAVRLRTQSLTPEQRIAWNGTTLQIHGVRPLSKSYVEALCSEVA